MTAATRTVNDDTRSNGWAGTPWGVWLTTGMLALGAISSTFALIAVDAPNAAAAAAAAAQTLFLSVQLSVFGLAALALARRHPLGHRLCLVLWVLMLLFGVLGLWLAVARGAPLTSNPGAVGVPLSGVAVIGLLRPSTRAWFGLQCPRCRSQRVGPKSLGMRRLGCLACDHRWDRRAIRTIDPTTFD